MRFLTIFWILLWAPFAFATDYTSASSGDWHTATTWSPNGIPGAGDTVDIVSGHDITFDGNIIIGTNPVTTSDYAIDIQSGTLALVDNPTGDWMMEVRGNIRIDAGNLRIGTQANPVPCNRKFQLVMQKSNSPTGFTYRIWMADNLARFIAYGCPGWPTVTGGVAQNTNVTRARISECSASPCTGAVTLTLDRDVQWELVGGGVTTNPEVLIGIAGGTTDPGANSAERLEITSTPADNQIGVTLANTHQVGDIVANVERNVIFHNGGKTHQPYFYSTLGLSYPTATNPIFEMEWVRFDQWGDSTYDSIKCQNTSAYCFELDHVAMTHCNEATGGGHCLANSTFNGFFDADNCILENLAQTDRVISWAPSENYPVEFTNLTVFGGGGGSQAIYSTSGTNVLYRGLWVTDSLATGMQYGESCVDCKFHGGGAAYPAIAVDNRTEQIRSGTIMRFENCEFYWYGYGLRLNDEISGYLIKNNEFYGCYNTCLSITNINYIVTVRAYGNSYNKCSHVAGFGAVHAETSRGVDIYQYNETFGAIEPNDHANLVVNYVTYPYNTRWICDNCDFAAPNSPDSWVSNGYGFSLTTYNDLGPSTFSEKTYLTLHAKNKVAGAHEGFGPRGVYIKKDSTQSVDNTLNLKAVPWSAAEWAPIELGDTYVAAGTLVTATIQVWKNESATNPPKLSLEGVGFQRDVNFDQMLDVNSTWDTLTVTGTALTSGTMRVYLEVRNNYDNYPGDAETPVFPATLTIYADGFQVTKD